MNFKLRDYQEDLAQQGNIKLKELGLVYLSFEVRTGKTLTALSIADRYLKSDKTVVLFVTKKKAISSIHHDYGLLKPKFELVVTNYESLHKVNITPCLIILDESSNPKIKR
jgi:hypothetical protein